MTARGKPGKPRTGFPLFPPSLESSQRQRASHIPTASTTGPYIKERLSKAGLTAEPKTVNFEGGPEKTAEMGQKQLPNANGTSVSGKTPSELESLFSATQPVTMRLEIDRVGSRKTFEIQLEKAEDVARQNGKRFVEGKLVPIWSTDAELHCFLN